MLAILGPKEAEIYSSFSEKILLLKIGQLEFLRRCARQKGIIGRLSRLRPESGKPFSVEPNEPADFHCRWASNGIERAYLCEAKGRRGCGWVIGWPRILMFDDLLNPEEVAHKRIYCSVCGQELRVALKRQYR